MSASDIGSAVMRVSPELPAMTTTGVRAIAPATVAQVVRATESTRCASLCPRTVVPA